VTDQVGRAVDLGARRPGAVVEAEAHGHPRRRLAGIEFEEPAPGTDPRRLTGSGNAARRKTLARLRVTEWLLTREPAAGESLTGLTDLEKAPPRLEVFDVSALAAALPGHEFLARQLGLHLGAVRYQKKQWHLEGDWTPPGATGRVSLSLKADELKPRAPGPRAAAGRRQGDAARVTAVQGGMTVTLERKEGDPKYPLCFASPRRSPGRCRCW